MRALDEKLANALGEQAGEYPSLCNDNYERHVFAEKSKFYNQVMSDGFVFNPYIHRRWLPYQYKKLCKNEILDPKLSAEEAYKFLLSEFNKLMLLSAHDREAFQERSKFFTVDTFKTIFVSIIDEVCCEIKELIKVKAGYFYIPAHPLVGSEYCKFIGFKTVNVKSGKISVDYNGILNNLEECKKAILNCKGYFSLKRTWDRKYIFIQFDLRNIRNDSFWETFYEAYFKSGGYYSCKDLIMFHGGMIGDLKGIDAHNKLREYLDAGENEKFFHNLYKEIKNEKGETLWLK